MTSAAFALSSRTCSATCVVAGSPPRARGHRFRAARQKDGRSPNCDPDAARSSNSPRANIVHRGPFAPDHNNLTAWKKPARVGVRALNPDRQVCFPGFFLLFGLTSWAASAGSWTPAADSSHRSGRTSPPCRAPPATGRRRCSRWWRRQRADVPSSSRVPPRRR